MIEGLNGLIADLAKAAALIGTRSGEALVATANAIAETARQTVPVDTGTLKASIEVSKDGAALEVGPTAPYGSFVEFGTSTMAPQPYMGPAADAHGQELENAIAKAGGDI